MQQKPMNWSCRYVMPFCESLPVPFFNLNLNQKTNRDLTSKNISLHDDMMFIHTKPASTNARRSHLMKSIPAICLTKCIHQDIVQKVQQKMPDTASTHRMADFYKLISDSTRVRILWALSESEMCVCDICALMEMKQSAVSQQLKNLKQSRIVQNRRKGKVVYYALVDDHIRKLMDLGMAHVKESSKNRRSF
jgi:ArsR family transcriptional regulator